MGGWRTPLPRLKKKYLLPCKPQNVETPKHPSGINILRPPPRQLCADLSFFIHDFYRHYAAVLAVDYRGYGWSTGTPQFSKLCPDADRVADKLPDILKVLL